MSLPPAYQEEVRVIPMVMRLRAYDVIQAVNRILLEEGRPPLPPGTEVSVKNLPVDLKLSNTLTLDFRWEV